MSTAFPLPVESASPRDRRRLWLEAALVGTLALILNLAGNSRVSLWDRDEPRYATCVREMRARNDWIFPTFNGEPRFHKPVLIYWLMRAGYAVGGDNPFGARLVSSVAGASTCLVLWALGRRMMGARAGLLGALILATAPIMVAESKLATTDATLAFLFISCQFCLWELSRAPSRGWAALFWILAALSVLTKGPVIPVFLVASGVVSWWWGGPSACWSRLRWRWGVPLFLAVALPWFIAIGIVSKGAFFAVAVGFHVIQRVTTGLEEHGGFPGYYVILSLVALYPWSAFVPPAAYSAWKRRRSDPLFGFLLGWILGPLLVLELVRTKLIHYYLPAYPACALIVAWLVLSLVGEEVNLRRWPLGRLAIGLLAGSGIALLVGLTGIALVASPAVRWPCLMLALVLGAGTPLALGRLLHGETGRAAWNLVATWAVFMFLVGAWLLPALEPYRPSRAVATRLANLARTSKAAPVLLSFQEPSVIYAMGRPVFTVRTWTALFDLIEKHDAVVAAILPHELKEIRSRRYLEVTHYDDFHGFSLTKGQSQTLHFVRLRIRDPEAVAQVVGNRRN